MTIPGVTVLSGVQVTPRIDAFLRAFRARVPADVPITITSAYRGLDAQAAAMLKKYQLGGAAEIRKVYSRVTAEAVLAADPSTWAAVLGALAAQGHVLSRHPLGDAVDVRIVGLSSAQVAALVGAAQALRAHTLVESNPVHLHINRLGFDGGGALPVSAPRAPTELVRSRNKPLIVGIMTVTGAVIALLVLRATRRR